MLQYTLLHLYSMDPHRLPFHIQTRVRGVIKLAVPGVGVRDQAIVCWGSSRFAYTRSIKHLLNSVVFLRQTEVLFTLNVSLASVLQ